MQGGAEEWDLREEHFEIGLDWVEMNKLTDERPKVSATQGLACDGMAGGHTEDHHGHLVSGDLRCILSACLLI
jgi:hypothetical protein